MLSIMFVAFIRFSDRPTYQFLQVSLDWIKGTLVGFLVFTMKLTGSLCRFFPSTNSEIARAITDKHM